MMIKSIQQKYSSLPLRWKLFIIIGILSLIPVILITGISMLLSYKVMEKELVDNSRMSIEWLQERLELEIDDFTRAFYSFEIDSEFRGALQDWCKNDNEMSYASGDKLISSLNRHININSNINSIQLYNLKQNKILNVKRSGTYFSDKQNDLSEWENRETSLQTNTVFMRDEDEILLLHQMYYFETGTPYALIVIRLRPNFIQDLLSAIKANPHESILLFNDSDKIIEKSLSENKFSKEEVLEVRNGLSLSEKKDVHKAGYYWFFRPVNGGKLNIIKAMPDYAIRETLHKTFYTGILVSIFTIIFSLIFSVWFSQIISKPISDLAETMLNSTFEDEVELEAGERKDEIAYLYKSFNYMQHKNKLLIENEYKSRITLREAQLYALQSQINPHFIYNTLQLIGSMAIAKNAPEIYSVITDFGDLLRYSLNFDNDTVKLEEELQYFKSYLSIQNKRFGNKIQSSIDIPHNMNNILVPKLILQPILENSIKHGLSEKEGVWKVSVRAERKGKNDVRIIVADNGIGIPENKLSEIQNSLKSMSEHTLKTGKHIGLANVNMRIKLRYGADYGVFIENNMDSDCGVKVILRIKEERMNKEVN